jgi:hypothetical protein
MPAPHYSLIETSRGEDPAIVVVNSALRLFTHRDQFPWHLEVSIQCKLLGDKGMPTPQENQVLYQLEDALEGHLRVGENAVFLARVTCRGKRELSYRVRAPKIADDHLSRLVSELTSREWEYRMEHDAQWKLAAPVLELLERDPKIN